MSGKAFVDTNILVYAHDNTAGIKHKRAQRLIGELWDSGQGVLSTQVLQELYVNLRNKTAKSLPIEEIRLILRDYSTWDIITNSAESILLAVELELRYKISFWDALIVHAAQSAGADTLYSEDLAHGQSYGGLRVINPLLNDDN